MKRAFYFDVGGVLIPDKLAPDNALNAFRELGKRHGFDPVIAHATYTRLQPGLDLGKTSLAELCAALGIEQQRFEHDWLAMHAVNAEVIRVIEQLVARGHSVGFATNFCRSLLDNLIADTRGLSGLVVCCSADIGFTKPAVEFFEHANAMMGPREIVFVDDRSVNIDAARQFGWTSILATDGWLPRFNETYLVDANPATAGPTNIRSTESG